MADGHPLRERRRVDGVVVVLGRDLDAARVVVALLLLVVRGVFFGGEVSALGWFWLGFWGEQRLCRKKWPAPLDQIERA